MNVKLIATDLDGTLFLPGGKLGAYTIKVVRACEAQGIRFVLASGRTFENVRGYAKEIGLSSPIISCNGGRVDASPAGPILLADCMPAEVTRDVIDLLADSGLAFDCYCSGVVYESHRWEGIPEDCEEKVWTYADGYENRHIWNMTRMRSEAPGHAFKLTCGSDDLDKAEALRQRLARLPVALSSSSPGNIEIMGAGCGKGRALETLMRHFGLSREEVMAFGDNTNDLDMLRAAGIPVAVENAVAQLKEIAAFIAPPNTEEGEARLLERLILLDNQTGAG